MLALRLKQNEFVQAGHITIHYVNPGGGRSVRLAVDAPKGVVITRSRAGRPHASPDECDDMTAAALALYRFVSESGDREAAPLLEQFRDAARARGMQV